MNIKVLSLEDSPGLKTGQIMKTVWPQFMTPTGHSMKYWVEMRKLYPSYQFCLCSDDKVLGMGNSIPITWSGLTNDLPLDWTDTLVKGVENKKSVNTLAAVNIAIHPDAQRLGLSQRILTELKNLATQRGFQKMVVPVRPSFKVDYPLTSFERYIHWTREDGAPFDPWIRTHWKLGATIIKPIPKAFTVRGSVGEWEEWTNMKFPDSGPYIVKGALQPIVIKLEEDYGEYDDPNVWMEYKI
jgi:GNAT superfamily N-acetyltransferase